MQFRQLQFSVSIFKCVHSVLKRSMRPSQDEIEITVKYTIRYKLIFFFFRSFQHFVWQHFSYIRKDQLCLTEFIRKPTYSGLKQCRDFFLSEKKFIFRQCMLYVVFVMFRGQRSCLLQYFNSGFHFQHHLMLQESF